MQNSTLIQTYQENAQDLLRFLVRRLRCAFTARDLAQEVYLRLLKVDHPTEVRNSRAYLFQVAANLATDHLRGEARRTALLAEVQDLLWSGTDGVTPERQTLARDELERLRRVANDLPPLTRRAFFLSRFEGKPLRAIAEELGVSQTTVEKHLRRALDRLARARDGR